MSSITVNEKAEYLIRQNRRVYTYLAKLVDDPSEYHLNEDFKTVGGDNFISANTLIEKNPNIFDILITILRDNFPSIDFSNIKIRDDEIPNIDLEFNHDIRLRNNDKAKKTKIFRPIELLPLTNEQKSNGMKSYVILQKVFNLIIERNIIEIPFKPKTAPTIINNKSYFALVEFLFSVVYLIESLEQTPKLDWNNDDFVQSPLTIHEIKLALFVLGTKSMSVVDVNFDFEVKLNPCGNQLWIIYILNVLGSIAYQLPYNTVTYFMQAVTDTATGAQFSSAYQWAFSLTQAFGVVVWHRLADKIGRKPIFLLVYVIYTITNILTALVNGRFISSMLGETYNGQLYSNKVAMTIDWLQIVIRIIQGFFGLCTPLCISAVNDLAPPSIRARALGINGSTISVASFAASLFIAFGFQNIPWVLKTSNTQENCMIVCSSVAAGLYLICVFLVIFVLKETSATVKAVTIGNKLGIKIEKDEDAVKPYPFAKCFRKFWTTKNLVLIFFAYLTLLGSTQAISTSSSMFTQSYLDSIYLNLLTDANIAGAIGCGLAVILILTCLKPLVNWIGELKAAVSITILNIPNIIYRSSPPPVNMYGWAVLGTGNALAILACEACLMALAGNETIPQNRGTIMGIMQVANSLGRVIFPLIWNSWFTINARTSAYSAMLITTVTLFLIAFMKDTILAKDVAKLRKKQMEQQMKDMNASKKEVIENSASEITV